MKETPILFKSEMVRAILNGSKKQTRRVVKPPTPSGAVFPPRNGDGKWFFRDAYYASEDHDVGSYVRCPYGQPGDRLWVRETWISRAQGEATLYRADYDSTEAAGIAGMYGGWKPSIHMHHWRSRISLELTAVRVERVQDISRDDALAEGVDLSRELFPRINASDKAQKLYHKLWDSINGKRKPGKPDVSWNANPFCWVIEFKRIDNAKL